MHFDDFTLSCYVAASKQQVMDAWTKSGELEKWFLTSADFVPSSNIQRGKDESCQPEDNYWFKWKDGSTETGIIESVSESSLRFSFGSDVSVEVQIEEGERTLVLLTQLHEATDEETKQRTYTSCLQGWTFYLTNLKSVLEAGNDLRELRPDRMDLVNL
jgi:uncharacterized protein YndB with AHSA1/START domain